MPSRKKLILPVALSLLSHVLLLAAAGLVDIRLGGGREERVIIVNLEEAKETPQELKKEGTPQKASPKPPSETAIGNDEPLEETIDLDSRNVRFATYLATIKQRIEKIWTYPPQAFAQRKEGRNSVVFSLASTGQLVESKIVASSGYEVLDQETLNVVQTAAHYAPFPPEFHLSLLHIQASFKYRFLK